MDMSRRIVGRLFFDEDGKGGTSNRPVPDFLLRNRFASHAREIFFRGEMEGGFGPVIEMNLTRSPASSDFFIVSPANDRPTLSLSMLEVHNDLASHNVPNFEIRTVNGDHIGSRGRPRTSSSTTSSSTTSSTDKHRRVYRRN